METIISVLIGGAITWFFAWWYYRNASKELLIESAKLKKLNELMLAGMEYNGWLKLNRNKDGEITGFIQVLKANSISSASEVTSPTVREIKNNDT